MMNHEQVMRQALEALYTNYRGAEEAARILKSALAEHEKLPMVEIETVLTVQAEPVQEPVAYRHMHDDGWEYYDAPTGEDCERCQALYTAPPQRKPLTEEEMYIVEEEARKNFRLSQAGPRGQMITYWDSLTPWLIRAVERAHRIGE